MARRKRYPAELREQAVRLLFAGADKYGSQWEAICSIAEKLGPKAETVRKWVRRAETDQGRRGGVTTEEREKMRALERENKELRRANEILKAASVFFARGGSWFGSTQLGTALCAGRNVYALNRPVEGLPRNIRRRVSGTSTS